MRTRRCSRRRVCGQVVREGRADAYRSSGRWVEIFQEAGLKIVKEEVQEGLPEELFTVKTYVLYIYHEHVARVCKGVRKLMK